MILLTLLDKQYFSIETYAVYFVIKQQNPSLKV